MKFISKYLIPILLGLLVINSVIGWFIPQGMTNEEHLLKVKLLDMKKANIVLERKNDKLLIENQAIYENINVDSVMVWDADRHTRDSLRATINPR